MRRGLRLDDRFEVEGFHASGGMGVVYRARDLATGDRVALKVVDVATPADVARFEREADALACLTHPGIVRYIAHGDTPTGSRYLAEEWVNGVMLDRYLSEVGLSLAESVTLMAKVAEALADAHARGIVHRDIKPSNVILSDGDVERPRILDFGIARLIDPHVRITGTGTAIGTPGYMAPEQALGHTEIDARLDVFSLGCVLYCCIAGVPPFDGSDLTAVRTKIALCAPLPLGSRCPEAPAALTELVDRMIAKAPADRPRDAAELSRELAAIRIPRTAASARRVVALPAPTQVRPSMLTSPDEMPEDEFVTLVIVRQVPGRATHPSEQERESPLRQVARAAAELGVTFEPIDALGIVARIGGRPIESATRAARSAILITSALPSAGVAIGCGLAAELPSLIDVCAAALERGVLDLVFSRDRDARIRVDALTAELLAGKFQIDSSGGDFVLRSAPVR